ncbi:NAD(P)/FAD-dependent oxidoreductase [Mangrovicoccus algicola]|uniref:NAD(P)/FAD-dependent oxidoreductase n=1 Tax=Mangrovicoccus algicola TaxID=2771008 RepID=A0A8J7CWR4_9RHOB|nr:NAD(P)/FAD-dependent oxidoreductase [Mangrovicoccus algicola]MBE3639854.1 NAD(P)/FAD-dependent oxidoreductase [Mangrovicoccus algicola]
MTETSFPPKTQIFDAAVIGAGIVGCAIARRLVLDGLRVVVLERAPDILDGASKANSAILHTGFDAPPGSLELDCIRRGHEEYLEIRDRMNLPLDRCGALVLAWDEAQEAKLPELVAQAEENGVTDTRMLSRAELLAAEPGLAPGIRAGFRVPGESLIDPWSAPHAYLLQALENGASLLRGCAVTGGGFDGTAWRLETTRGALRATHVVNAAGLHGDRLDRLLHGESRFEIRPRKGQFVVFDKTAARLARHILLPVPTATTKGIVVCRTIWGNLLVGPTAEEQADRDTAALVPETLEMLVAKGAEILPALAGEEITTVYAGLRPATEEKPYRVETWPGRNAVTAGGIRSTGLSAALGLARHVSGLLAAGGTPLPDPAWPVMPMLAEDGPRDWQCPGNGGILCHCELVTRREVDQALSGPLAARSLAGLKRRTRATMGRCQGFYCSAALAEASAGRLARPMTGPAGIPADGGHDD